MVVSIYSKDCKLPREVTYRIMLMKNFSLYSNFSLDGRGSLQLETNQNPYKPSKKIQTSKNDE